VANQALFVASFSLAAQTRLITSSDATTHDGAFCYIVCMTIATTSCMICAAGLTNFDVLMTDMLRSGLADKNACDRFADKMDRLVFVFCSLFAVGCVSFLAGLGLLGWGIGINDGSPDGGDYSQFTWVIAAATAMSGAVLVSIVVVIVVSANRIRQQCSSIQGVNECVCARSAVYETFMAEISMVGEQVTLCCGYVSIHLMNHRACTAYVALIACTLTYALSCAGNVQFDHLPHRHYQLCYVNGVQARPAVWVCVQA
jgi:hypothetical protein